MLKQATILKITGHINPDALTPLVPIGPTSIKEMTTAAQPSPK